MTSYKLTLPCMDTSFSRVRYIRCMHKRYRQGKTGFYHSSHTHYAHIKPLYPWVQGFICHNAPTAMIYLLLIAELPKLSALPRNLVFWA